MNHTMHPAIAAYIDAANARDAESLLRCFASDAVVVDEEQTHRGTDEVRAWIAVTQAASQFTLEPISVSGEGAEPIVSCRVTGTFPGSPLDLRHFFTLEGDKISALSIRV